MGGYYNTKSGVITICNRTFKYKQKSTNKTLLHELIHKCSPNKTEKQVRDTVNACFDPCKLLP